MPKTKAERIVPKTDQRSRVPENKTVTVYLEAKDKNLVTIEYNLLAHRPSPEAVSGSYFIQIGAFAKQAYKAEFLEGHFFSILINDSESTDPFFNSRGEIGRVILFEGDRSGRVKIRVDPRHVSDLVSLIQSWKGDDETHISIGLYLDNESRSIVTGSSARKIEYEVVRFSCSVSQKHNPPPEEE